MCYNSKILCYVRIRLNNVLIPIITDNTSIGSDTGTDTSIAPPLIYMHELKTCRGRVCMYM